MSSPETRNYGPTHYKNGVCEPWDLTAAMRSSGNAHVDGCRCAIIKYAFRIKGDKAKLIDDLQKASHYALEAVAALQKELGEEGQQKLELFHKAECSCRRCYLINSSNTFADAWKRSEDCLMGQPVK